MRRASLRKFSTCAGDAPAVPAASGTFVRSSASDRPNSGYFSPPRQTRSGPPSASRVSTSVSQTWPVRVIGRVIVVGWLAQIQLQFDS